MKKSARKQSINNSSVISFDLPIEPVPLAFPAPPPSDQKEPNRRQAINSFATDSTKQPVDWGFALLSGWWVLHKRWERLAPLFTQLEQHAVKPARQRAEMSFKDFNRDDVLALLLLCFKQALLDRWLFHHVFGPLPALKRAAQKIRLLLKERIPPSLEQRVSKQLGTTDNIIKEQQQRKRRLGGKCPTRSIAVTLLANYFSRCQAFEAMPYSDAERYQIIGKIVQELSTPSCLACGRRHPVSSWREVKSIDRYKGPWKARHQRGGGGVLDVGLGEDYRIRQDDIKTFDFLVLSYIVKEDLKKYGENSKTPTVPLKP